MELPEAPTDDVGGGLLMSMLDYHNFFMFPLFNDYYQGQGLDGLKCSED